MQWLADVSITSKPKEVRDIAIDVYRELLSVEPSSEHNNVCREITWARVHMRVIDRMRRVVA